MIMESIKKNVTVVRSVASAVCEKNNITLEQACKVIAEDILTCKEVFVRACFGQVLSAVKSAFASDELANDCLAA